MLEIPDREIDVVGVGTTTVDRLYLVPEFPSGDGVQAPIAHAEMGGGPTSTALCVVAALGGHAVMIDRLGTEPDPRSVLSEYRSYGVDVSQIRIAGEGHTGHASVLVRQSDGARAITYQAGSVAELGGSEIDWEELVPQARILHMNGRHPGAAAEAIQVAKRCGTLVSFDGGAGRFRSESIPLFSKADILIVSREFGVAATGEEQPEVMLSALAGAGEAKLVGVTMGEQGSWLHLPASGETFHQPATIPDRIVDTTGCGDTYHGAFLHAICQGLDLRAAAVVASHLAAKNCQGLGGRYAIGQLLVENKSSS